MPTGRPQLVFMSGLVCDKPILGGVMDALARVGDVHFVEYFRPELDSMAKLSAACVDRIMQLDPDRPIVLVTFSMGGYISPFVLQAMDEAKTLGRITAVCGIESTPYDDQPARTEQRNTLLRQIESGDFASVVDTVVERDWYSPSVVTQRPDIIAESKAMILALGPEVFMAQTKAIRDRPDVTEQLEYFTMPVLTISAEESNLFKAKDPRHGLTPVEALEAGIPGRPHEVVVIPGAGHLVPRTHPDLVASAIGGFLRQIGVLPDFILADPVPTKHRYCMLTS